MKPIEIAAQIARVFEGFFSKPYRCPAGVPTIGIGSTTYSDGRKVKLTDPPIDEPTATAMMYHELSKTERGALKYCPVLIANPGALAAITDFCYNLGVGRLQTSTLRRRINQQDWPEVRKELLRWVRGGGRILSGLVRRRSVEAALIAK